LPAAKSFSDFENRFLIAKAAPELPKSFPDCESRSLIAKAAP
jgi:hypothetical protein